MSTKTTRKTSQKPSPADDAIVRLDDEQPKRTRPEKTRKVRRSKGHTITTVSWTSTGGRERVDWTCACDEVTHRVTGFERAEAAIQRHKDA